MHWLRRFRLGFALQHTRECSPRAGLRGVEELEALTQSRVPRARGVERPSALATPTAVCFRLAFIVVGENIGCTLPLCYACARQIGWISRNPVRTGLLFEDQTPWASFARTPMAPRSIRCVTSKMTLDGVNCACAIGSRPFGSPAAARPCSCREAAQTFRSSATSRTRPASDLRRTPRRPITASRWRRSSTGR